MIIYSLKVTMIQNMQLFELQSSKKRVNYTQTRVLTHPFQHVSMLPSTSYVYMYTFIDIYVCDKYMP